MTPCIVALDLGTTSNRAIAYAKDGAILATSSQEFPQYFPKPAWVEHDANEIWASAFHVLSAVVSEVGAESVQGIGITNQRETTVVWNRKTGKPIHNAIVWQCRRTTQICKDLDAHASLVKSKTGLFLDPYFSATKIKWMLDECSEARELAENGELAFGTIDTWAIWKLTEGRQHVTEPSNASRTLLVDLNTGQFDDELCDIFHVPQAILPKIVPSNSQFGICELFETPIPITGVLGDQQASLFAQGGWKEGLVKNTYGTGLFINAPTQQNIIRSNKLLSTIAWQLDDTISYSVEGSVFVGGSAIQWLRDKLELIENAKEINTLAATVDDNGGVYFVPALSGLGAPYWDPDARGLIIGLTRGTKQGHIARATLESLAYQTHDVINAMSTYLNISDENPITLRVDGGACQSDMLMQFQANISQCRVERPQHIEVTALGAAGIAGYGAGFWTLEECSNLLKIDQIFKPEKEKKHIEKSYAFWKKAVQRSLSWNE